MNRYDALINEVRIRKPLTIMEIGTWKGIHAKKMIETAILNKSFFNHIIYYGFDLFEDFNLHEEEFCPKEAADSNQVYRLLKSTRADIHLKIGNTRKTLPHFHPNQQIDFVFIDGGHSIETIQNDWNNVTRLMDKETVVIFDDYYPNNETVGCKKLIIELEENPLYNVTFLHRDILDNLTIDLVKVVYNPLKC